MYRNAFFAYLPEIILKGDLVVPILGQFFSILRNVFKKLLKSGDGNFGMFAALLAVPVIGAAGIAVDYTNLVRVKTEVQNALDSGTIAVAAKKASTMIVDKSLAMSFFAGNSIEYTVASLDFTENADGTLTGRTQLDVKTHFMGIFGMDSVKLGLTASANALTEEKLEQMKLIIHHAQGAFSKDIYFFTRDADGNIQNEELVLQYRYDGMNKSYYPSKSSSKTVNVGDYASFGYSMVVYQDLKYKGAIVNPKKYYSDDANASNWTRKNGTCEDLKGIFHQWEDGGDSNFLDFQFYQECTSIISHVKDVRLLR